MAIVKQLPIRKYTPSGVLISSWETSIISEKEYVTDGESFIVVTDTPESIITLNREKTDNISIKCNADKVIVRPDYGKIDDMYEEIDMTKGVCVSFWFLGGTWWITSSDGNRN
jgi:hypothetical protein